ncbi:MAG: hypothetical protein SVK44_00175 [Nitrospirota bacterium]|nr:hypothetical protein [Nitrospirota bacterium]
MKAENDKEDAGVGAFLMMSQVAHLIGYTGVAKLAGFKGREGITRISERRLRRLVRYTMQHSPFYAKLYKGINPDTFRLQDLPPINKQTLMENFDDIITEPGLKLRDIETWISEEKPLDVTLNNRYKVFKTSGSSGKAAIIVYDIKEIWKSTAYEIARGMGGNIFFDLPRVFSRGLIRRPLGVAVIAVIGPHHGTASGMFSLIPSFFLPSKGFSVNSSDEKIVEELNRFDPFTIVAYPTKLEMLAHAQLEGKLDIHPKYIKTISEVLTPSAKALIEKAFGVGVRDTYAASEAAVMAGECQQSNGLHIHEDVCLVEPVDKDGNPVQEGELSHKVYVTNLLKYTQPLIRYELEDVLSVTNEPCPCGMQTPRIEAVYGRNFDMLWVKMADGSFRHLHPQGVDAHITLVKGVKNYQVIQEDFNRLKVYILLDPDANEKKTLGEVKKSLLHTLKETGVESAVLLDIMSVSDILRDPVSQKIRRIISKVQPAF